MIQDTPTWCTLQEGVTAEYVFPYGNVVREPDNNIGKEVAGAFFIDCFQSPRDTNFLHSVPVIVNRIEPRCEGKAIWCRMQDDTYTMLCAFPEF